MFLFCFLCFLLLIEKTKQKRMFWFLLIFVDFSYFYRLLFFFKRTKNQKKHWPRPNIYITIHYLVREQFSDEDPINIYYIMGLLTYYVGSLEGGVVLIPHCIHLKTCWRKGRFKMSTILLISYVNSPCETLQKFFHYRRFI